MASHLRRILLKSLQKPFKVDLRDHCEYNLEGCISRTLDIPRKELIQLLEESTALHGDVTDRIDITEYHDEDRYTLYNPSRMDRDSVHELKDKATKVTEWDPEPQYGNMSARGFDPYRED